MPLNCERCFLGSCEGCVDFDDGKDFCRFSKLPLADILTNNERFDRLEKKVNEFYEIIPKNVLSKQWNEINQLKSQFLYLKEKVYNLSSSKEDIYIKRVKKPLISRLAKSEEENLATNEKESS